MRNLKKFLALVLATLMIVSAMVMTSAADAKANHDEAVSFLNLIKVYLGNGESMAADELVTRWQMALFVSRVTTGFTDDSAWANAENTTPFTDVEAKHYLGAIACAYNAGIINGRGDNKFDPDANISYQEALAMAVRALGYKGLAYPGETVQTAVKLGLTDNLEELDNKLEANVTRGQIAEIIKNALYATAKDGTTLLEAVFKMEIAENAVVVATPKQALVGGVFAPANSVRLALNDAANTTIVVSADLLLKEGEKVEDLLGYSFTLATDNGYKTLVNIIRCDSKVVKNFNSDAAIAKKDASKIKIEGTEYALTAIDVYTVASASGTTVNTKGYYYNLTGDIVDLDGTILLYNIDGEYWKNISTGTAEALVKATAADFEASLRVVSTATSNDTYVKMTSGNNFTSKYAEMKLFDDNGDGKWDRAIYTPYSIAKITVKNETNAYNASGSSYGSTKKDVMYYTPIDGSETAFANKAGNKLDSAAITFVGGKPAKDTYVIYHYNKFTMTLTVVENLGAIKTDAVSEVSGRGSYVVIGGVKYNYNLGSGVIDGYSAAPSIAPAVNALVNKTYNVKYVVLGDYVLVLETPTATPVTPAKEFTNFAVFSWGDVKGVDADGNLLVNAVVDQTGAKKDIKITSINNYKVGLKLADVIAKAGLDAIDPEDKYVVGSTSSTTSTTINYRNFISSTPEVKSKMLTNIYAAKVNADGTYTLVTFDFAPTKIGIPEATPATADVTFQYGITKTPFVTAKVDPIAIKDKFDTTSNTVYLFVGSNNYKLYKGVAPDGATVKLSTAPGVKVYNATSNFVFVTTTGNLSELIDTAQWEASGTPTTPAASESYFAITKNTYAALTTGTTAAEEVTLTIDNAYNVFTGKYQDVIVRGDIGVLQPIFNLIDTSAFATVLVVDENGIRVDTNYVDVLSELNNAGYTKSGNVADNSGDKTGYTLKLESVTEEHLQSISLVVFWKDGNVQTINGKEGYKFAGVDYAQYKIDANGNLTGFVFAPSAKAE